MAQPFFFCARTTPLSQAGVRLAVVGTIELENAGSHKSSHLQAPADVGPVPPADVEKSTS